MDDLCQYSYNVCRQSMSVETIGAWVEFIDTIRSSTDGTATPDVPPTSVFGQYAQRLRDDVFHFLVVTLPEILEVQRPQDEAASVPNGRDVLLQIYSRVPFEMFKSAVESPTFMIGTYIRRARPLYFFDADWLVGQEPTRRASSSPKRLSKYASVALRGEMKRRWCWHLGKRTWAGVRCTLRARCASAHCGR